jgi:23S rRNA (cytosine1962-C5)-methyltransferase
MDAPLPAVRGDRRRERNLRHGYLLGLSLLSPGGILATSSCTELVDMAKWYRAFRDAAADARAGMHVFTQGGQSAGLPVLPGMPETEYRKSAVLR